MSEGQGNHVQVQKYPEVVEEGEGLTEKKGDGVLNVKE